MTEPAYSDNDIGWVQDMLRMLKNNGTWACPCSRTVFRFDKKNKTYSIVDGSPDDPTNRITTAILENELEYTFTS